MSDDYIYSPKPLPRKTVIGSNATAASQVSSESPPNFPFGSDQQLNPPYGGVNNGGGGGGGSDPTCSTNWDIGTVRTSSVGLPCSGTVAATLTDEGLVITVGSKTLIIELNGSDNQIFLDQGTKSVRIDPDDLTDDGADASFKELDVCHMGAPGKRVFLASDAYAA